MTGPEYFETEIAVGLAGLVAERIAFADCSRAYRRLRRRRCDERLVAVHEAGHSVMAHLHKMFPRKVTIVPDTSKPLGRGFVAGFSLNAYVPAPSEAVPTSESPAAEPPEPDQTDGQRVFALLRLMGASRARLQEVRRETEALLVEHWHLVERLANALEERKTLSQSEIEEILGRAA